MSSQIRSRIVVSSRSRSFLAFPCVPSPTGCRPMRSATSPSASTAPFKCSTTLTPDRQRRLRTATGTSGGLAFDAGLNLFVANTTGNQLVKIAADATRTTSTVGTQPSPAALAFAADGSVYVASLGGTIRRLSKSGATLRTFTVATDSTTCIGIDLSPDQKTLFMVSGGRTIKTISDVSLTGPPPPPAPTVTTFATLQQVLALRADCGCWHRLMHGR